MKLSTIVSSQLPNFISGDSDYSKFVNFLEAYYEWMEQKSGVLDYSENILNLIDVDKTLDQFVDYFYNEVIPEIPKHIATDKRKLIPFIREFYRTKGTRKSYKFLFRALYDSDCEVTETNDFVVQPSNGLWYNPISIKLKSQDERFLATEQYFLLGETSKTFAKIERVKLVNQKIEIFLAEVKLLFSDNEYVKVVDQRKRNILFNSDGEIVDINGDILRSKLYRPISKINIDTKYRGNYYFPNNPVVIYGGLDTTENNPKGAKAVIGDVNSGYITKVTVDANSCLYGYRKPETIIKVYPDNTKSTIIEVEEVDDNIITIDNIIQNSLGDLWYSEVQLDFNESTGSTNNDSTNYGISNKTVNASTKMQDAFTYISVNTANLKSVIVEDGGGGFTRKPELFAYGMYATDALYSTTSPGYDPRYDIDLNSGTLTPKRYEPIAGLGILAPISIIYGGTGYAIEDEINFTKSIGDHAYARVSKVDNNNGKILEVEYYTKETSDNKYPKGGFGYSNENLPELTVIRSKAKPKLTGTISTDSKVINNINLDYNQTTYFVGDIIIGTGIPEKTTITAISYGVGLSSPYIKISNNASKSVTNIELTVIRSTAKLKLMGTGTTTVGSNVITDINFDPNIYRVGDIITGSGILDQPTITEISGPSLSRPQIVISNPATKTATNVELFIVYGDEAQLIVPGIMGGSAKLIPITDRIGSINSFKILDYGEDYVESPTISLKIEDFFVKNILDPSLFTQGIKLSNIDYTYKSVFDSLNLMYPRGTKENVYVMRVYDYNKSVCNKSKKSLLNQIYLEYVIDGTTKKDLVSFDSSQLSGVDFTFFGYKITCDTQGVLSDNTKITKAIGKLNNVDLTLSSSALKSGTYKFVVYFPITIVDLGNDIISTIEPNSSQNTLYNTYLIENGVNYDLELSDDKIKYDFGVITYGDGTAKATAGYKHGIIIGDGRYLSEKGQLSSDSKLQDSRNNSYSYFLDVEVELLKYKRILKELLHPAGTKVIPRTCVVSEPNVIPSKFEVGTIDTVVHKPLRAVFSAEPNSISKPIYSINLTGSIDKGSPIIKISSNDALVLHTIDGTSAVGSTISWGNIKSTITKISKKDNTITIKDASSSRILDDTFTITSSNILVRKPDNVVGDLVFDDAIKLECKNVGDYRDDQLEVPYNKNLSPGMSVISVVNNISGNIQADYARLTQCTYQITPIDDDDYSNYYIFADDLQEGTTILNVIKIKSTGDIYMTLSQPAKKSISSNIELKYGRTFSIPDYKFRVSVLPGTTTIKSIDKNIITLTNPILGPKDKTRTYYFMNDQQYNLISTEEDLSTII